jgi:quinol monooxygenase YgiN
MHDVQVRCNDEAARQEVLGALRLLCAMVEASQAGKGADADVLTFIGMKALDNETGVRIFARYKSREIMEEWQRGALIKTFWAAVKPGVASMEAKPYAPNGKGWLWK